MQKYFMGEQRQKCPIGEEGGVATLYKEELERDWFNKNTKKKSLSKRRYFFNNDSKQSNHIKHEL